MRRFICLLIVFASFLTLSANDESTRKITENFYHQCDVFMQIYNLKSPSRKEECCDQVQSMYDDFLKLQETETFRKFYNTNRDFRNSMRYMELHMKKIVEMKYTTDLEVGNMLEGIRTAYLFREQLLEFDPNQETEYDLAKRQALELKQKKILKFAIIFVTAVLTVLSVFQAVRIFKKKHETSLAKAKLEAKEQERSRISAELHDTVGQMLKTIRQQAISDSNSSMPELLKNTDDCIKEIRSICFNLMPPDLNLENMEKKFEQLIYYLGKNFSQTSEIEFTFVADEELPEITDPEKTVNLFRIVQEALNNIKKHSQAKNASVVIRNRYDKLVIFITDDGVGINQEILDNGRPGHFGLSSMKERAKLIGADIHIESIENDGTRIRIEA